MRRPCWETASLCLVYTLLLAALLVLVSVPAAAAVPGALLAVYPAPNSSYAFGYLNGVAVDASGLLYVADESAPVNGGLGRVVVLSSSGALLAAFPNASDAAASQYSFNRAVGVAVDGVGRIYVADFSSAANGGAGRVVVLSPSGALLRTCPDASSDYSFQGVVAVALDSSGQLYVSDRGGGRVAVLSSSGALLRAFPNASDPAASNYTFLVLSALAVDASGDVYAADLRVTGGGAIPTRVLVLSPSGVLLRTLPPTYSPATSGYALGYPAGLAVDSSGFVYVADSSPLYLDGVPGQLRVLSPSGALLYSFPNASLQADPGSVSGVSYSLVAVFGVAVDASGALYVVNAFQAANGGFGAVLVLAGVHSASGSSAPPPSSSSSASSTPSVTAGESATLSAGSSSASVPPGGGEALNASLCALFYSLPGDVDYPFSIATSLTFQYNSTTVTNSLGTAVQVVSGSGVRTFTNRFGVSFSTGLTIASAGTGASDNLLYLASSVPVDSGGLLFTLATPVQLPGQGPSQLYSQLTFFNTSGYIGEGATSRLDLQGQSFLSSIRGFRNITIGASNVNSLSASYPTCQAPITFTNGLRVPTQPSTANGAVHYRYVFSISDGVSYRLQANLTLTVSSAFATAADQLGSPYQTVVQVAGTHSYTYLPTGATVNSTVTGLSSAVSGTVPPSQRFYPYSLLSSAPGVYSQRNAPFVDGSGVGFSLAPSLPIFGAAPGSGAQFNATALYIATSITTATLAERNACNPPILALQTQTLTLLS